MSRRNSGVSPESVVDHVVSSQYGQELFLHSARHDVVIALIDRRFHEAFSLADGEEVGEQLGLEVGDAELKS